MGEGMILLMVVAADGCGHPSFSKRERATGNLAAWHDAAGPLFRRTHKDPEVVARQQQAARMAETRIARRLAWELIDAPGERDGIPDPDTTAEQNGWLKLFSVRRAIHDIAAANKWHEDQGQWGPNDNEWMIDRDMYAATWRIHLSLVRLRARGLPIPLEYGYGHAELRPDQPERYYSTADVADLWAKKKAEAKKK